MTRKVFCYHSNDYDAVLSEKEILMTVNNKQTEKEIRNLYYRQEDIRLEEKI